MKQNRILFILPYFGPLPAWFDIFLLSCEYNPDVDFLLITDQPPPAVPPNVTLVQMSLPDFLQRVETKLGLKLKWTRAYKLCDLKPTLGFLFKEYLKGHTHWGFCDSDILFGRISHFFNEELLSYDLISTHSGIVSGHLAVFSNTEEMLSLFSAVPHWNAYLENADSYHFDENKMAQIILGDSFLRYMSAPQVKKNLVVNGKPVRTLFREQYSTFVEPRVWKDGTFRFPGHWEWREGVLRAPFLDNSEMLYLHFMNWCSNRWTGLPKATWADLPHLIDPALGKHPKAFAITPKGFVPLAG